MRLNQFYHCVYSIMYVHNLWPGSMFVFKRAEFSQRSFMFCLYFLSFLLTLAHSHGRRFD